ncbi:MAG: family 10 glycosylhydrolase [Chitinophagales bacterium]
MDRLVRTILVGLVWLCGLALLPLPAPAAGAVVPAQFRAFWVDAFHDGIKTPEQVDRLVADALAAHVNTLIVQVRRRGDAYYSRSPLEPQTEDQSVAPGFDPLQYLLERAHAQGLEVHAWLTALPVWNSATRPQAPGHVWNLHQPPAGTGAGDWLSYVRVFDPETHRWSTDLRPSYDLDPGNPAALDYTVEVYLNIVRQYAVDGLHLDLCRYSGAGAGYNPTSVARFNAWAGTTGLPEPEDPRWSDWRREQVTNLVRKVYLRAIALNPRLKVSAATIAWGAGPQEEGDWTRTRSYAEVFQDWRGWLAEGIIDLAIPMNYDREWNETQRRWYDQWLEWEKDHQYGRGVVIGVGLYQQYPEQSLAQLARAALPSAQGNRAAGVALYSYGSTSLYATDSYADPASPAALSLPRQPHVHRPELNAAFPALLSQPGGYSDPATGLTVPTTPVFPTPVPVPDLPWKSHPTRGFLMGTIEGAGGRPMDQREVTLAGPETRVLHTDGHGWFGAADLLPGEYVVSASEAGGVPSGRVIVKVEPGKVAEVTVP